MESIEIWEALKALTNDEPRFRQDSWAICVYCSDTDHRPSCPWLRAKKLRDRIEEKMEHPA